MIIAILLVILCLFASILAWQYVYIPFLHNKAKTNVSGNEVSEHTVTIQDLENKRYITDCEYSEVFDYPEVYDIPFQKTEEYYIRNKDLNYVDKEAVVKTAQNFFNALIGTGYREIQTDPKAYAKKIGEYSTSLVYMEGIYPVPDDDYYTVEEIAETLGDYFVRNRTEQENEFKTNTSLVYGDYGQLFVRGVLENTAMSSEDKDIPIGEKIVLFYDVSIVEDNNSPTGYSVEGLYLAKGKNQ